MTDLRRVVLNDETLTNFAVAINNTRTFSEQAIGTVNDINTLVATNNAQINLAVGNAVFFSQELARLAGSARNVVSTNSEGAGQCGSRSLDEAAVAGIGASNPFPPLPTEFKGERIVVQLNFAYNMPRR